MTTGEWTAKHDEGPRASTVEEGMLSMLKRHEIQVLLKAGHGSAEVAKLTGAGERSVRRIGKEGKVEDVNDGAQRKSRGIGRPSTTEAYRPLVEELLEKEAGLMSLEILRQVRQQGYEGGKSAMYSMIASLRPKGVELQMRFEGLPGEFSQHDFGQVDVNFIDGTKKRVHFFASRLKWSRWAQVTPVPNQSAETLIRTLADHFVAFGGMPLLAVFDRPKTVALKWKRNGEVTEWNPIFAYAAMEMGFGVEVCWPYQARQKGSVENLVKWVKNSFFKQRRFHDDEDMLAQLAQWHIEVNEERPSRATEEIPAKRRAEELPRLRKPKVPPEDLALRIPVQVGPTAIVVHDTHPYSMPPEAAGLSGTLYLYRDRVRIVAGRYESTHDRRFERNEGSTLPEHRAARLAVISGKRGKRYLKRQDLLETGEAAVTFLTELVHRRPRAWISDVDELHELLQCFGADSMNLAFREAVHANAISAEQISHYLGRLTVGQLPLLPTEVSQ